MHEVSRVRMVLLAVLLVGAHAGLLASVTWVCLRMVLFLAGRATPDEDPPTLGAVFWGTVLLWCVLTILMLRDSREGAASDSGERESQHASLWKAILVENLVISGPTAYFIGGYRQRRGRARSGTTRHPLALRVILDVGCFLSYWGWMVAAVLLAGALATGLGLEQMTLSRVLALAGIVLLPLLLVGTFWFASALLLHAGRAGDPKGLRPPGPLSPWAWVTGLRCYYRATMRPSLEALSPGGTSTSRQQAP
jgi:hypothetical protein